MTGCRCLPARSLFAVLIGLLVAGPAAGSLHAEDPPPAGGVEAPAEGSAASEKADWQPAEPMPEKFDWIQLKSGEWLKGELIALYDEELEFDSDELEVLTLDWADVRQVRTAQVMDVSLLGEITATGRLWIEGDTVRVIGDEVREFKRSQIVTIASGSPSEFRRWSGKVSIGLTVRQGNVNQTDFNNRTNFMRRTIVNRLKLDYVANFSHVEGTETINNQRVSANWDRFLTDRFFTKPVVFDWYRDPFQNISSRTTLGVGAGYQLVDTARTEWDVSGGPGYQETHFTSVQAGQDEESSTGALTMETNLDQDWTKAIEFGYQYRAQFTNESSGKYNHHMVMSFETEWTSILDFDLSMIWDRTEMPQPDSQGIVPEQDDYRLVVGLGIEF